MTVKKHEILTVRSHDDDPKSIIDALLEMPPDTRLIDVEPDDVRINVMGHRFGLTPVTFTFRREVTDA